MSSVEERLTRDIAAVTRGVVESESDLRDAREADADRIDSRRQRDHRRTLAAVGAAAVVVPILGYAAFHSLGGEDRTAPPVSPAPTNVNADDIFLTGFTPSPELVAGVWRVDNGTMLLRFTADGEVRFDDVGGLYSDPKAVGSYQISDDLITLKLEGGAAGCAGQTLAVRASLPKSGAMRFVHVRPGTGGCETQQDSYWVLEQVLPTNNDLRGLTVPDQADWTPPADLTSLHGDWLAAGGGYVLELAPGGAYYVAEESGAVVDRGRWAFDDSASRLDLVSAGSSPTCEQGDRVVLGGVEQADPNTLVMRGSPEQNTCGGAWATAAWILLPKENG
jgi:hypothetical protein